MLPAESIARSYGLSPVVPKLADDACAEVAAITAKHSTAAAAVRTVAVRRHTTQAIRLILTGPIGLSKPGGVSRALGELRRRNTCYKFITGRAKTPSADQRNGVPPHPVGTPRSTPRARHLRAAGASPALRRPRRSAARRRARPSARGTTARAGGSWRGGRCRAGGSGGPTRLRAL